ncbi:di-heme-cytochrome C peroxidase [Bradyrhizobium sp.]|uniref:di-heme-cytochrome C peroxidase n=1 Tax=Bradyrhizobium sp. TaxID=376 RepID=UPI003C3907DF
MTKSFEILFGCLAALGAVSPALAQSAAGSTATPVLQYARQGWTAEDRQFFYTTSQGSRIMPYLWFKALRRLDVDEPFGGDQLARYGYLPNDKSRSNPEGLAVGFVIDGDAKTGFFGMSCAACHTAQIEYQNKDGATQQLRIDGAPATADFQAFLIDLTAATRATLSDADRFDKFARAVLGDRYTATRAKDLKTDFAAWVKQWGDFMDKSLPASHWGPGRLDAFGMIFNRVAGKDLGIEANFKIADAPVSYPFLWNASRQDKTQWNGDVPNGLYINAIGRNAGEVFGVFAEFTPKKQLLPPFYSFRSSVNFVNLQQLEEKIVALKPPPWPFALDPDKVNRGRVLFAQNCGSCHDQREIAETGNWLTPVKAVGTDSRMFENALRTSQSGVLAGALTPNPPGSKLSNPAATTDVLAAAVVGALFDDAFPPLPRLPNPNSGVWQAIQKDIADILTNQQDAAFLQRLQGALRNHTLFLELARDHANIENLKTHLRDRLANLYKVPGEADAYESRVLHGIWATAPYLHNGSVPNLWELLTPPAQRKPFFMVGSRKYDPVNVGYVTDESPSKDGKLVVGGSDVQPGNSNAGHDFGTGLSDDEKWQLIEYLKQL